MRSDSEETGTSDEADAFSEKGPRPPNSCYLGRARHTFTGNSQTEAAEHVQRPRQVKGVGNDNNPAPLTVANDTASVNSVFESVARLVLDDYPLRRNTASESHFSHYPRLRRRWADNAA